MDARAVLEGLAEVMAPIMASQQAVGYKHDASGVPIAVGYSHGPGGNFSFPGTVPDVFHTVVGNRGIIGQLPAVPSVFTNPVYTILTGVQDISGSVKSSDCGNAPTAGLMKVCRVTAPFGWYELATPELELNRLGKYNDPSDPMDLTLVGSPIHANSPFGSGARSPSTPGNLLENEVARKLWELNVAMHRELCLDLWQGNPANAAAGGAYQHIAGFAQLINTGYVDAITNTACPSVNSDLKDFGCDSLDANQDRLIDMLSNLLRTRMDLAFRTGMDPVRWVLAMRPELFWELTAIYPCSYLTYRCQVSGNEQLIVTGGEQAQMRDDMRRGRYLIIDGERIQVVLDDGILVDTPTTNPLVAEGCQCSDIYLIPMSVVGGRAVTYMEYFDYTNPSIAAALGTNLLLGRVEGPFLTWPRQTNQCWVFQTKTEPRLVLRTPWLAGRIQNVEYCPTQQARTPFPDDPYFLDGGLTSTPGPSYYTPWGSRQ